MFIERRKCLYHPRISKSCFFVLLSDCQRAQELKQALSDGCTPSMECEALGKRDLGKLEMEGIKDLVQNFWENFQWKKPLPGQFRI